MLPGKQYTIDDALRILRARYWLVLLPFAVIGAAMAWYQRGLPDVYSSEAVILIVPQKIPENYAGELVNSSVGDRVDALSVAVLSRSTMRRVIERFDLYPDMRRTRPMDDVVDRLRENIDVRPVGGNSFRVRFSGSEPALVTRVAEHLSQLFIAESSIDRQNLVQDTSQFLDAELNDALEKLRTAERRLSAWKQAHAGELPSQLNANLAVMQTTQSQLSDLRTTMNQDRARRQDLEEQLSLAQDPATQAAAVAAGGGQAPDTASTERLLREAEAQVVAFEQRGLRPGHPDLDAARRKVRDLQARYDREMSSAQRFGANASASASEAGRQRRINDLKNAIAQIDKRMEENQETERRLLGTHADVKRRVEAMPARESEATELTRDYDILAANYRDLLSNKTRAQLSANVEKRQVGEQFRLTDPARVPEQPDGPNRPRSILMGLAAGLALGLVLVVVLEFMDRSFKTDQEIADLLNLPVLAVVPVMESDADVRSGMWRQVLMSTGLGGLVAVSLTFVVYALVKG